MKSLHVHIDHIVVDGLPHGEQKQFVAALEQQLRTWAQSGVADQFQDRTRKRIPSINAGSLRVGATPIQVAGRIVQSLDQSIGRGNFGAGGKRGNHV